MSKLKYVSIVLLFWCAMTAMACAMAVYWSGSALQRSDIWRALGYMSPVAFMFAISLAFDQRKKKRQREGRS